MAVDSKGILYLTAGSSSGSKYYDLVPRQQTYIANRWQEDVPTYTLIDVTETTLTFNTYRSDNDEKIDSEFTIVKSVSHQELSDLINKAKTYQQKDYTKESFTRFNQALQGANKVNENKASTSQELANAYKANERYQIISQKTIQPENNTTPNTPIHQTGQNQKNELTQSVQTDDQTSILFPITLIILQDLDL